MKVVFNLVVLFYLVGYHSSTQLPAVFFGKVVGVKDGDTIEVLYDGRSHTIRLVDIDSPEKKQAFGQKSKQFTSDLCFGKQVRVERNTKPDRYKRILATVFVGKINLNQELVKTGFAWHFTRYSNNQIYTALENKARKSKVGLWVDPNPIAPWDFRRKRF